MVIPDLFLFVLSLGISGFIVFKTFQWVFYEEIGHGATALFLGFAILVFFAVNNYDFVRAVVEQGRDRSAGRGDLEALRSEIQSQMETTRHIAGTAGEVAESARELALEAQRKGQAALEAARKTHRSSGEINSITAWAAWELLMGEFTELEGYLRRWEEKNGLTRGRGTALSVTDLANKLEPFSDTFPDAIKDLYLNRQRKYEILKKMRERSEISSSPLDGAVFELPAPPRLPHLSALKEKPGKYE